MLLDGGVDAGSDQRLALSGLAAEPGGKIRHGAERAVVVSAFETDPSQGGITGLDANAQAELDPALVPGLGQFSDPLLGEESELYGVQLVVLERDRVVEEDHDPVAGEVLKRARVARDQLSQRLVVGAQHVEEFLWSGCLGEGGEPAQVAEEAGDIRPMPGQQLFALRRG